MSKFSENISEWKEHYPFLDDIWKLYEEFNESAVSHEKKTEIISLCEEQATNEYSVKDTYNYLCRKLLKNLLLLLTRYRNDYSIYINRCNDLYNWLYHETKPHKLTENILPSIFNLYYSLIQDNERKYICPYESYNEDHYKYEKIIELNIFEDNIEKLRDILKDRNSEHYCPCIKYVNNCVKTYKKLDKNYCTGTKAKTLGNVEFCNKLNKFITYYGYLTDVPSIISEIPSLSSEIDTYKNECLSEENKSQLNSNEDNSINQLGSTTGKTSGNSTSVAASTVVGAMVGIPPFLALMYKFTPIGQFFRSRYKNVIANNIEENELFYPTTENMNSSSDHTRYNVLYGPVRN